MSKEVDNVNIFSIGLMAIEAILGSSVEGIIVLKEIKDGDWTKINEAKDIIYKTVTPDTEVDDGTYQQIAIDYTSIIKYAMGILPTTIEDIPIVIGKLSTRLDEDITSSLTKLYAYSILDIDMAYEEYDKIKDRVDPICAESILECIRLMDEHTVESD